MTVRLPLTKAATEATRTSNCTPEGFVSGIWSLDFDIVSDFEFRVSKFDHMGYPLDSGYGRSVPAFRARLCAPERDAVPQHLSSAPTGDPPTAMPDLEGSLARFP